MRARVFLVAAFLLAAALTPSAADDAVPAPPKPEAAQTDGAQTKAGSRGPHSPRVFKRQPFAGSCTDFYPAESQRLVEQGEVTIGYAIAEDGTPRNLTILKSSGIGRLDQATLACAAAWHLPLITKDGIALFSPGHQATIVYSLSDPLPLETIARIAAMRKPDWSKDDPSVTPSRALGGTHDCSAFYPDASRRAFETGEVLIGYDVEADGTISNVKVLTSSGHDALDDAALTCARTVWRNTPASKDGVPITSPGHEASVVFSIY